MYTIYQFYLTFKYLPSAHMVSVHTVTHSGGDFLSLVQKTVQWVVSIKSLTSIEIIFQVFAWAVTFTNKTFWDVENDLSFCRSFLLTLLNILETGKSSTTNTTPLPKICSSYGLPTSLLATQLFQLFRLQSQSLMLHLILWPSIQSALISCPKHLWNTSIIWPPLTFSNVTTKAKPSESLIRIVQYFPLARYLSSTFYSL